MDCVNAAGFFYRPKDTTQGHCNNKIFLNQLNRASSYLQQLSTPITLEILPSLISTDHKLTNIGKFTFKYSASVIWETVPMALKKTKTFNRFKKLYKAHLISCQSNNICSV